MFTSNPRNREEPSTRLRVVLAPGRHVRLFLKPVAPATSPSAQ